MVRKWIMLLLIFVSLVYGKETFAQTSKYSVFSDVSMDFWAFEAIEYGIDQQIVSGYPDNTFRPNDVLKRAHVAKMLYRVYGDAFNTKLDQFADVQWGSEDYYAFDALYEAGFYQLVENNKIFPYKTISRGETAIILATVFQVPLDGKQNDIKDVPKTSKYYRYVNALVNAKVTNLYDGAYFKPDASLTRAQFITFVARLQNPYFYSGASKSFDNNLLFHGNEYGNLVAFNPQTKQSVYVDYVAPYKTVSSNVGASRAYVKNGVVYYMHRLPQDSGYVLMKYDGKSKQLISKDVIEDFVMEGNKIYYIKSGEIGRSGVVNDAGDVIWKKRQLVSINLDGSGKSVLRDFDQDRLAYNNGWVYFVEDGYLNKLSLSTGIEQSVLYEYFDHFEVYDEGIIVSASDDETTYTYALDFDGNEEVQIEMADFPILWRDGYLYYDMYDEYEREYYLKKMSLYRMNFIDLAQTGEYFFFGHDSQYMYFYSGDDASYKWIPF